MTVGTFPLVAHVLKLEWDKAASYPACQGGQWLRRQLLLFPPKRGLGQSPKVRTESSGQFQNALSLDHDETQFLSANAPGLQPPDIDHQLPADGHHGFFL